MSGAGDSTRLREAQERVRALSELVEGVALVFVAGPAWRARSGLAALASVLGDAWERRWYRFDLDEEHLDEVLPPLHQGARRVVLAHGLAGLASERTLEQRLRALNLRRDRLRGRQGLALVWVPHDLLDALRRYCRDLLSWRSAFLRLEDDDLGPPQPAELAAQESLQAATSIPGLRRALGGPGGAATWLVDAPLQVVLGAPGSGKSRLSLKHVHERMDKGAATVWLRAVELVPFLAADDLGDVATAALRARSDGGAPYSARDLLRGAGAHVVIDALDEVERPEDRERLLWLMEQARASYPSSRFVITSRPWVPELEGLSAWSELRLPDAAVEPWRDGAVSSAPVALAFRALSLQEQGRCSVSLEAVPEPERSATLALEAAGELFERVSDEVVQYRPKEAQAELAGRALVELGPTLASEVAARQADAGDGWPHTLRRGLGRLARLHRDPGLPLRALIPADQVSEMPQATLSSRAAIVAGALEEARLDLGEERHADVTAALERLASRLPDADPTRARLLALAGPEDGAG